MITPSPVDRTRPPGLKESFRFPLATPSARSDLLVGGTALCFLLPIGWVLNMGHRLNVVERVFHNEHPYFCGFTPWTQTLLRGLQATCAILTYLTPSACCGVLSWYGIPFLEAPGIILFCLAIYVLPGGMTYNAAYHDISYLYRPDQALLRAIAGGRDYAQAWGIALLAIVLSFVGLLGLGVGFFYTSVWAWMVVGYAFSRALSLRHPPDDKHHRPAH